MRRLRRAKIVATLGPASSNADMIAQLFKAGADVFRINMSHTTQDRMRELVGMIRAVERDTGRPIGVLIDLQGPKLRLGTFTGGSATVKAGDTFVLDADTAAGDAKRAYLPHPEIFATIKPGHTLLIDDGKVRLTVTEADSKRITTRVAVGGKLSDRKGVSLPDTTIPFSALTDKDRSDLEAALETGIDWVALSFIQRPEDIAEAKKITRGRAAVMAKIEKPQAVNRLSEIMDLADALMVARGDLGVEMPLEKVPGVQKQMTRACRVAGKPVVVATQMLESMISAPVPTRAEVSDVATAIFEGADAVMLSAEIGGRAISGPGGCDDEQDCRRGRRRPSLPQYHHRPARCTGSDWCGRDRGCGAPYRRHARSCRGHLLDVIGLDRVACRARTSAPTDRCAVTEHRHWTAAGGRVGRPLRGHRGRSRPGRHG